MSDEVDDFFMSSGSPALNQNPQVYELDFPSVNENLNVEIDLSANVEDDSLGIFNVPTQSLEVNDPPEEPISFAESPTQNNEYAHIIEQSMKDKESEEAATRAASREAGKKAFEKFLREREERITRRKQQNRLEQEVGGEGLIKGDTFWERVCSLIDFEISSNSEKDKEKKDKSPIPPLATRDTTRMKTLLLSLKTAPPKNIKV